MPQTDDRSTRLIKFIKKKLKLTGFVSMESIFCGRGLPLIYQFLMIEEGLEDKIDDISGKEIVRRATVEQDPVCLKVVDYFMYFLGLALCSLSSITLPRQGIILC